MMSAVTVFEGEREMTILKLIMIFEGALVIIQNAQNSRHDLHFQMLPGNDEIGLRENLKCHYSLFCPVLPKPNQPFIEWFFLEIGTGFKQHQLIGSLQAIREPTLGE